MSNTDGTPEVFRESMRCTGSLWIFQSMVQTDEDGSEKRFKNWQQPFLIAVNNEINIYILMYLTTHCSHGMSGILVIGP